MATDNDPGIILRTPSSNDVYWNRRAIFVHGVKTRKLYDLAVRREDQSEPRVVALLLMTPNGRLQLLAATSCCCCY